LVVIVSAKIHRDRGGLASAGGTFQRVIRNIRVQNIFVAVAIVTLIQDDLPARLFFAFIIAPHYLLRASALQSCILSPWKAGADHERCCLKIESEAARCYSGQILVRHSEVRAKQASRDAQPLALDARLCGVAKIRYRRCGLREKSNGSA
jgi:hypothetical protein